MSPELVKSHSHRTVLHDLVAGLDTACLAPGESIAEAVRRTLERATRFPAWLAPAEERTRRDGYTRHVLHADPLGRYTVVAIVWEPGQCSPVHGHATWCAYTVVSGCLHESTFAFDPGVNAARLLDSAPRPTGATLFSPPGLDEIHRLGNAESGQAAVSVHVYGLDGARVATDVNRVVDVVA